MPVNERSWFERIAVFGAAASLLAAPVQWSLEIRDEVNLSLVDPLLALTAVCWGLGVLRARRWRALRPPLAAALLVLLAALSALVAEDRGLALKNIVQFALFFGAGLLVWRDILRREPSAAAFRAGGVILALTAAVNLAVAAMQYAGDATDPMMVRGAFLNRNVFGGYLALVLPLWVAIGLHRRSVAWRVAAVIFFGVALVVNLSGFAFVAMTVSLGAGLLATHRRVFLPMAFLWLVFTIWGLPNLPRNNEDVLFDSMALYEPATGEPGRRYPEWQAAVVMTLEHPWLGVGIGNFQRRIGQYYILVPNRTGAREPDTQNLFLVLSSSLGLPALLCFLALLADAMFRAAAAYRRAPPASWERTACWAIAVGLGGWTVAAMGSPLLVRGIFPLVTAFVAGAYALDAGPDPAGSGRDPNRNKEKAE